MGGCVGEMYALKAFKAYKDLANGEPAPAREEPSLLFLTTPCGTTAFAQARPLGVSVAYAM
jgi:hypothetical protein